MSRSQSEPTLEEAIGGILVLAVGALLIVSLLAFALGGWYTVDDGQRAVETRFGEVQGVYGPGPHLKVPIFSDVHYFDVRTQAYKRSEVEGEGSRPMRDGSITAHTKGGNQIFVSLTVRSRTMDSKVGYIYENVAPNQELLNDRVIRPRVTGAVTSSSVKYSLEELHGEKRDDFIHDIEQAIDEEYAKNGVELISIDLQRVAYSEEVQRQIDLTKAAEKELERKKIQLKQEEIETERKIIEAEGIAESNRIISDSLTDEYISWYWIQEGLKKGDAIYVPIGNDGLPLHKDVDKQNETANN